MKRDVWIVCAATICALCLGAVVFTLMSTPSPATQELRRQIAGVTEVKIFSSGLDASSKPLFIFHGAQAQEFAQALQLNEKRNQHYFTCACYGTHKFEFYRSGAKLGSFYYKDRGALHSNDGFWQGDLPLTWQSKRYLQSKLKK